MSFDPFEEKHANAILKKACRGKSASVFAKTFDAVVSAEMGPPSYNVGGVSVRLGEECLALAEVVAAGRGHGGKAELPVVAEDWLNKGPEFADDLAASAQAAVDKVRTKSASWAIAEDMGGWPAWTNYCRGLSTRLKKPAKKRKATAPAEGIDAVIKRLRSKQCQIEKENGHVVALKCTDEGQLTDADLADIVQLRKLKALILSKQPITDKGLGTLSELKQLRDLAIDQCQIKGRGFKDLDLPRLHELELGRTGVNVALSNCQHLTGLRVVSFRLSDLTDSGLAKLAFAESLESLNVNQCSKLTGKGFTALTGLKRLKELSAISVSISRAGFEAISSFTTLRHLQLMHAKIPVKQVPLLGDFKRLENLDLSRTGVSDNELTFLSGLRKLKELDLSGNDQVTDETVRAIAKLPLLEDLSLWDTGITQESIDMFLRMKSLREVGVSQPNISRAAEKRLEKALRNK